MTDSAYPYSQGDRLNDRNTYFYSEFRGPSFLSAWFESRSAALAALPEPVPIELPAANAPDGDGYATGDLLGYLLSATADADALIERLLQRFEVSKRLYRRYAADFRAVRDSGYDDLDLYLQFAALCVHSQSRPAALRFLNALLKALDSLVSVRERLSSEQAAGLAWLIGAERTWVADVAARGGVKVLW